MTKQRQLNRQEEIKNLILQTAKSIVISDGISELSIRKITSVIGYSPAIIYHYFRDKDDIIDHLLKDSYKKLINVLTVETETECEPKQKLKNLAYSYINTALQMPDEYKNIMLSSSENVLQFTSVLFDGAPQKRQALGILCSNLKQAYSSYNPDEKTIEITAQVIWASIFGLIIRLIIEKNVSEEQRNRLIISQVQIILDGADKALTNNRNGEIL